MAFSEDIIDGAFSLIRVDSGQVAFTGKIAKSPAPAWGGFAHYYVLDFSAFESSGRYRLRINSTGELSRPFTIGIGAYEDFAEELLRFMRHHRT